MRTSNHLGLHWTREEDEIIWNGAEILKLSDAELSVALTNAGFTRTTVALNDRLRRIRKARKAGTPLRYFGHPANHQSLALSEIEILAARKPWK